MPDKDVPWLLLERYYAGTCTPAEQLALEEWIAEDPRRRLLVERLRIVFGETPVMPSQSEIERKWSELREAMDLSRGHTPLNVTLLAVALLVLVGLVWFLARR